MMKAGWGAWPVACVGAMWWLALPAWSASESIAAPGPVPEVTAPAGDSASAAGASVSPPVNQAVARVYEAKAGYPEVLRAWGQSGAVRLSFNVDAQAHVGDIRILSSPHPAFEEAAIDAVVASRYQPAQRAGVPVSSRVAAPFEFALSSQAEQADEGVGLFRFPREGDASGPVDFRYDTPPRIRVLAPVVYPLDLLERKQEGSVALMITESPKGDVSSVTVLSATHPAFGQAAKAAWLSTSFVPARKEGQPCWAAFKYVQTFARFDREAPAFAGMAGLLGRTGPDAPGIYQLPQLDSVPKAFHQPTPVYPRSLRDAAVTGKVWVRFFIDKQGKARLPKMTRGDNPELGALAETAVMRWRFEPPMVGGKPVEVVVVAPFDFSLD